MRANRLRNIYQLYASMLVCLYVRPCLMIRFSFGDEGFYSQEPPRILFSESATFVTYSPHVAAYDAPQGGFRVDLDRT